MNIIAPLVYHILVFTCLLWKRRKFVYLFPIFAILYDALGVVLGGDQVFFSGGKLLMLLGFNLVYVNSIRAMYAFNRYTIIFGLYAMIMIVFGSDFYSSLLSLVPLLLAINMASIGYIFFDSKEKLHKMNVSMIVTACIFILNSIISNLLHLGMNLYGLDFYGGGLFSENSFIASLFVVLSPLIIASYSKSRIITLLVLMLSLSCIVILFLNGRRGAFLLFLVGLAIIQFVQSRKNLKSLRITLPIVLLILALFIANKNYVFERLEQREVDVYNLGQSFEDVPRTVELQYIINRAASLEDPFESLFGNQLFAMGAAEGVVLRSDRHLHVTLSLIIYGLGFVGLVLFLVIPVSLISKYRLASKLVKRTPEFAIQEATFWGLLSMLFIVDLYTKGLFQITYPSTAFLYIGAIIRQLKLSSGVAYKQLNQGL